jgi:sulfur carrier protein ThiS
VIHANSHTLLSIDLTLYATLKPYKPHGEAKHAITPGITVAELITQLSIPSKMAVSVYMDGKKVGNDHRLWGNEAVKIFPIFGGG